MCTPPSPPLFAAGGELSLQQNFQKRRVTFQGSCSFYIKNKLQSEIFNDKKSLETKMFFSILTKNLNWEILTKNLVIFKR